MAVIGKGLSCDAEPVLNIASTVTAGERRHDVDWLRVLALGLLMIYHTMVSFQPWAILIFFIQNEQSLEWMWVFMAAINVWRIPILFMISGMGVRFAMERRDWKQILKDRTIRILLPLVFGFFFICPISVFVAAKYYGKEIAYIPNAGHLWFLANIFLYVLVLLPLMIHLRKRPDGIVLRFLSRVLSWPMGLYLVALPVMVEAWLVDPEFFPTYAMTPHGFWLGMICFFTGFVFISLNEVFWQSVERFRWGALATAFFFYMVRLVVFQLKDVPNLLIAFESMNWMLAIFGYASMYLNKPSDRLGYLSKAVFPVYIIHLPAQFCISYYLLPLPLPAFLKLFLLLASTLGLSLVIYEFVVRRLKWVQPLFGMKVSPG